jgi:polysaccharide export outer membrane protein
MAGDIINVNESILSAGIGVMNELTAPAVGLYSVYSLFNNFN